MTELSADELEKLAGAAKIILPVSACCENCDVIFGSNGEVYLATMTDAQTADPAYLPEIRQSARELIVALVNHATAIADVVRENERLRELVRTIRQRATFVIRNPGPAAESLPADIRKMIDDCRLNEALGETK